MLFKLIIALSLLLAPLTVGASDVSFANPVIYQSGGNNIASTSSTTNGVQVTFTAPGWVLSNDLGLSSSAATSYTLYATVKSVTPAATGFGIGLIGHSGGTCASGFTTAYGTSASVQGKADQNCPADFLTLYTVTTQSSSQSALKATSAAIGTTSKWVITSTASAGCFSLALTKAADGTAIGSSPFNSGGTCAASPTTSSAQQGYFVSTKTYAVYAELETGGTAATVCFQTELQYGTSPGVCTVTTSDGGSDDDASGAGMVTAMMAPIMMLMVMLFN